MINKYQIELYHKLPDGFLKEHMKYNLIKASIEESQKKRYFSQMKEYDYKNRSVV